MIKKLKEYEYIWINIKKIIRELIIINLITLKY
jgi:hypothetical protein